MAITLVTGQTAFATDGNNSTTAIISLPSAPAANNLVVVCHQNDGTKTVSSCTGGNVTFSKAKETQNGAGTATIMYGISSGGAADGTFTVTLSAKQNAGKACEAIEFTGNKTTSPLDTTGSATGSNSVSDPATIGSLTPTDAGDVIVGCICITSNTQSWGSPTNSFSSIGSPTANRGAAAYRIITSIASYDSSFTNTSSERVWAGASASFFPVPSPIIKKVIQLQAVNRASTY